MSRKKQELQGKVGTEVSPKFSSIFFKPVDSLSIHIDLPRLARNVSINGLKPPSTQDFKTPIRGLCFEIILLLCQKLDLTQHTGAETEAFLLSLATDSHLPTDLLRLFHQPFFSETRSLRVLKACTQSLLAPVITLLKSHLEASGLSFNSSKNSWRLAISTQRADSITVQHFKKEVASPEAESSVGPFVFEWTAIFSFDLEVRRLTDVDIVLLAIELDNDLASEKLLSGILDEVFENVILLLDEDYLGPISGHSSTNFATTPSSSGTAGHLSHSAATIGIGSASTGSGSGSPTNVQWGGRGISASAFAKTVEARVRKLKDKREKHLKHIKKSKKKSPSTPPSSSSPTTSLILSAEYEAGRGNDEAHVDGEYCPLGSSLFIPSPFLANSSASNSDSSLFGATVLPIPIPPPQPQTPPQMPPRPHSYRQGAGPPPLPQVVPSLSLPTSIVTNATKPLVGSASSSPLVLPLSVSLSGAYYEKHRRNVSSSSPKISSPKGSCHRRQASHGVLTIATSIVSPREDQRMLQALERKATEQELVELLNRGASLHSTNALGQTPLHIAAVSNPKATALLLRRNADPNALDSSNWSPLHIAADNGQILICEELLKHGAKTWIENDEGLLAVQYFVRYPFKDAELEQGVRVLAKLGMGVDINHQDVKGETSIHSCCLSPHLPFLRVLLSLGGSCNIPNRRGQTPVHVATTMNKLDFVKMMLTHNSTNSVKHPLPLPQAPITSSLSKKHPSFDQSKFPDHSNPH
eukprot:TRINITY_DN5694_c0_g1_i1.p1 TRINITY_DN5694_c0_g1~~TRINITY_DN5694_c0_g1_i1.p1  ORF type:complete len:753 (-),score=123.13 TRINITY_DN5694_c0_g1_i1:13-2271(-)